MDDRRWLREFLVEVIGRPKASILKPHMPADAKEKSTVRHREYTDRRSPTAHLSATSQAVY